jgi:hypothetical protein
MLIKSAWINAYDANTQGTAAYLLKVAENNWAADQKAKYDSYQSKAALAETWQQRADIGCKKHSVYGWQGSYCGTFAAGCPDKNVWSYEENAPTSKCLDVTHRKQRADYAYSKKQTFATEKSLASDAYTKSQTKPTSVVTAENNVKSAIAAYESAQKKTEPMATIEKAIKAKDLEIQAYVASGGTIDKKRQRITFVDAKITTLGQELSDLNRERDLNEVNYQKLIADEAEKARIADEIAKQEEFKRAQTGAITKASIEANLGGAASPVAQSSGNNKMYILAGLALVVAGIYIVKRK